VVLARFGTFYASNEYGMKTQQPNPSADSLIQYLNQHATILTDQGINVSAFIDRLSAYSGNPARKPAKPRASRKTKT